MKDSLYSLLALQEIDKEIDALVRSKEEFPVEIGRLNEELDAARSRIDGGNVMPSAFAVFRFVVK